MEPGKILKSLTLCFLTGLFMVSCELFNVGGDGKGAAYDWSALIQQLFDLDGDGYCYFCAAGSDCDEEDPNNWVSCDTCADNDKDSWYAGCDSYQTIKGVDCDDADAVNWISCDTCTDTDGDSYRGTDCDIPEDCDESNFFINPGALDLGCDGIDNNCSGSQDDVVVFADPGLEEAVRGAIVKPAGDILNSDLCNLKAIYANGKGISDLGGLEYCFALEELELFYNQISDLSPIKDLTGLIKLYLDSNQIQDLSDLSGLVNLTELLLDDNNIDDVAAISGLSKIIVLFIENNSLGDEDLADIAALTNLLELRISYNSISDVSAFSALTKLGTLHIRHIQIDDSYLADIVAMNQLKTLHISGNGLVNICPSLSTMTNLVELGIGSNQISDISCLSSLTVVSWLFLSSNPISDISALQGLAWLSFLEIRNNNIQDLAPLVANAAIGAGDIIEVVGNPLDNESCTVDIPALITRGVDVLHDCP